MKFNYGIPYMGSKAKIVNKLCAIFPKANNFYDLFGGGFSVTHFMLENRFKDYKYFHFNEIDKSIVDLIKNAISGKFSYNNFKPKFIDRKEFDNKKAIDAYIRCVWSFGNNQKGYLFPSEIEPYKRSMHNAIIFNEFDDKAKEVLHINKFNDNYSINDRRLYLRHKVHEKYKNKTKGEREHLQQMEQLQRLERLEQLQRLERLTFTSKSYENVEIADNSIIYCDPPYKNTTTYLNSIDHKRFYNWAIGNKHPIYISEYSMPKNALKLIYSIKKTALFKILGTTRKTKNENIYANKAGVEAFCEYHKVKL